MRQTYVQSQQSQEQAFAEPFIYDRPLLITSVLLIALGVLMVASASMVISDRQFGYPFYYLIRQTVYLLLGIGLAWGVTRVPLRFWQQYSPYFLLLSLALLFLIAIPGVGHVVNGSRRWLRLGFLTLQGSEVTKLSLVLYLAGYIQRRQEEIQNRLSGFLKPMVLLAIIGVLLLLEPDFGTAMVIMLTTLGLLYLAGVRLWPFLVLLGIVALAFGVLAITSPYRLERLTTFLNPWHTQFGSGYQLTQSLIAFGRGGVFGVGLGNSIQKLFYLPEAHTDFLFAVMSEELGLVGGVLVILLFGGLVGRMLYLGRLASQSKQLFSAFVAFGFAMWFALQALINMGVNAGVLPTKGLTLPLISYGGSSMLIACIALGILMRISYELHHE